jgi:hypothetical protein
MCEMRVLSESRGWVTCLFDESTDPHHFLMDLQKGGDDAVLFSDQYYFLCFSINQVIKASLREPPSTPSAKHSTKYLPSIGLGEKHSLTCYSAKRHLPVALCWALGKQTLG